MRKDLPWLPTVTGTIPLVVMKDVPAYRAAVARLAGAFGSWLSPPASGGFTLEGIATSYWDRKQGILRPVYVHEFVHALVARATGLSNDGSWLQEGLASWFQSMLLPQDDLAGVMQRRIAGGKPIRELCDGHRIREQNYGEAMAVVGTLLEVPRWSGILEDVVEQAAQTGSTSLVELGVDLDALDADRRHWADTRFPL
ncbi:MAG: hypothetical protein H0V89_04030 [Deltaproteobacteria bacterium]|nr:hypothetical protein [Deltaproteobacteria bacterium]